MRQKTVGLRLGDFEISVWAGLEAVATGQIPLMCMLPDTPPAAETGVLHAQAISPSEYLSPITHQRRLVQTGHLAPPLDQALQE